MTKVSGATPGRAPAVTGQSRRLYQRTARYEWPLYLVSAPHRLRRSHDAQGRWEPYELWHARVPGAPTTACGLPAIGWPIFWWLRFEKGGGRRCADCSRTVALD